MQKGTVGMSNKLIIVSDGSSTAVLLNGQYLRTAKRISFSAEGGGNADFSADISLSSNPPGQEEEDFWTDAERILGYKLGN